ncbi:MAG: right-handed parallel beta-helix repeat-containing protein [Deltaproteobacteria bacterium]|nr:right-handed parallel beta-helix repeat-containing protein [Deltaproteobacteria bacterium]
MLRRLTLPLAFVLASAGCPTEGDDDDSAVAELPCDAYEEPCVFVDPTDPEADLLDVVNSLADNTTVLLGEGTFDLNNEVSINGVSGISLIGAGMEETVLDFSSMAVQGNGVFAVGDDFLIQDLTVTDSPKDGIRVEDSDGVTFRRVRATWGLGPASSNGAYGLYPVRVQNVIIEDSEALNASDAGIYVGQCTNALVRNNYAARNVAGIEIENTQFADVYGNIAEDNTGGLVIFDLPGNPIVGHDVFVHDNIVRDNNRENFAPGGTVAAIPAGTGTFAMASRRVEIANNTYENNNTVDIGLVSGLVIEEDPMTWALDPDALVGDAGVLTYDEDEGSVFNFRLHDIYVHGNTHTNSGMAPDMSDIDVRFFGFLLGVLYGTNGVDHVIYDGIQESSFDPEVAANVSNDNNICIGPEEGSMATMDAENLADLPTLADVFQPPSPFVPYDCSTMLGGPIQLPDLGQ